jgi:peroxiredoxin|tara:strand:- start:1018 stop:1539 length:522 start_codon:yes stop_codon:yes gene_type:complete
MMHLLVRSNYFLFIFIICCFDFHYGEDNKVFPNSIYDIDNNKIVLSDLSKNKMVCVITIKSVTCPICTEQLIRIRNKIVDFNKCNLTFLVLAPGGKNGIEELKRRSRFPFPFIQDSDFKISEYFNLAMPPFEIVPSIILLNKDGSVRWIQSGRGPDYYSDQALSDYLDCSNWI